MALIGPNESQAAAKSIGDKRPEHIHQKTSRGRTTHSITPASTGIISGSFVDTINNNTEKESNGDEKDKGSRHNLHNPEKSSIKCSGSRFTCKHYIFHNQNTILILKD